MLTAAVYPTYPLSYREPDVLLTTVYTFYAQKLWMTLMPTTPHVIRAGALFRTRTCRAPFTAWSRPKFSGGSNFRFTAPWSDMNTRISPAIRSIVFGVEETSFVFGSQVSFIVCSAIAFSFAFY